MNTPPPQPDAQVVRRTPGTCLPWLAVGFLLAAFGFQVDASSFDAAPFGLPLPEGNGVMWEDPREIHLRRVGALARSCRQSRGRGAILSMTEPPSMDFAKRAFNRALYWMGVAPPYFRFLPMFLSVPPLPTLRAHRSRVSASCGHGRPA